MSTSPLKDKSGVRVSFDDFTVLNWIVGYIGTLFKQFLCFLDEIVFSN